MTSTSRSEATFSSSGKLENQAASAALYATRDTRSSKSRSHPLLDEDGKLSSAGAATSLKYARAQDLPSFPSAGLKLSSAGAAASLADSNKKSFEHWQPSVIPAASKAADMAKDYQMDPLWQPEASKAGNSAAGQALKMKPPGAITERESPADSRKKALLAATASMAGSRRRADSAPLRPQQDAGWALKAARGSQKAPNPAQQPFASGDPGFEAARIQNRSKTGVSRQMYGSAPPVSIEVEEKNRQAMLRASAVAMAQKMYAIQQSHIEEAKAARRSDSHYAATSVHHRQRSDTTSSMDEEIAGAPRFQGLEEAAKKLAMERLAKLHDEHAEYRQYYGPTTPARSRISVRGMRRRASSDGQQLEDSDEENSKKIHKQMSMFQSQLAAVDSKKRQSDRDAVMAAAYKNVTKSMATMDEKVFQETGKQSPHQKELWEKEARERAQKDSDNRMLNHGKVHIGGGKYMDQSEVDAIARARLQPTLDEISEKAEAQRAKDEEIRIEEERKKRELETERTRQAQIKAEERAENQRVKAVEKTRRDEEKKVQKEEAAVQKEKANAEKEKLRSEAAARKEKARADAAAEKERLNAEKEEKRKSKDTKGGRFGGVLGAVGVGGAAVAGTAPITATTGDSTAPEEDTFVPDPDDEGKPVEPGTEAEDAKEDVDDDGAAYHHMSTTTPAAEEGVKDDDGAEANRFVSSLPGEDGYKDEATGEQETAAADDPAVTTPVKDDEKTTSSPVSPTKSNSKVKTWFKSRFRSGSKSQKDSEDKPTVSANGVPVTDEAGQPIEEEKESDSMRDVAMAGKTPTLETDDMYGASEKDEAVSPIKQNAAEGDAGADPTSRTSSISSASSLYSKDVNKQNATTVQDDPDPARSTTSSEPSRGRRGFKERIMEKISSQKESNAGTGSTAVKAPEDEEQDEARDTFQEQKLAPPPKVSTLVGEDTKPLSPKGSREGSKFKEDL